MLRLFLAVTPAAIVIVFAAFWLTPGVAIGCDRVTIASYYGTESGSRTATGEHFDGSSLTAAMPSRSHLGERWRVSYAGRSVVVRVNDVGPAAWTRRGIDLSAAAARRIGLIHTGVGPVCMERVG
jgi:rare lipoprotein A